MRDRLGPDEDKLFATVFLGSGVLFVGLLFVAAAATSAIVFAAQDPGFLGGPTFRLARALAFDLTSVYAMKMAAVFMFTASSLIVRTGFTSRWTALLGYGLGLAVLMFEPIGVVDAVPVPALGPDCQRDHSGRAMAAGRA